MSFALWLERKFLQLSPEFESQAWKYAQEMEQGSFRGGKLPVQSPGKELRWVPLVVKQLQGLSGLYDPKVDTIYIDLDRLKNLGMTNAGAIYMTIAHEGVHAFDPKTKIPSLNQQYASKVAAVGRNSPAYHQLPQEFEAEGGALEQLVKKVATKEDIEALKNWLRTGTPPKPQTDNAHSVFRLTPDAWKNNPQLWRQFREKFYTALERKSDLLNR